MGKNLTLIAIAFLMTVSAHAESSIQACKQEAYKSYNTSFLTSLTDYKEVLDWVCEEYKSKEAAIIFNDCMAEKLKKRRQDFTAERGANEYETVQNINLAKARFLMAADMCAGYNVSQELKK